MFVDKNYFSSKEAKKLNLLFSGTISQRKMITPQVFLDDLANLISSKYCYNHTNANMNRAGNILATYPLGSFLEGKKLLIVNAITKMFPFNGVNSTVREHVDSFTINYLGKIDRKVLQDIKNNILFYSPSSYSNFLVERTGEVTILYNIDREKIGG